MQLGQRLKQARLSKGITQEQLGDALGGLTGPTISAIEKGTADKLDNPLKNAPHSAAMVVANEWKHKYSREEAAYPLAYVRANKFWPAVGRVDNTHGDRNLICACLPIEAYEK